jgi:bacteriocin-type transport-associated protein
MSQTQFLKKAMRDILIKELSNSDIEWMRAASHQQEIPTGTILVEEGKMTDSFHLILDGTLIVSIPQNKDRPLNRAFAAIEGSQKTGLEIARLSSGEVVGEHFLIDTYPMTTRIAALENSLVMSIPLLQLKAKLKQDAGFAARFYRALAILFSYRLQVTIDRVGRRKLTPSGAVRDVLFIFGRLHDSDLDWAVANGCLQNIAVGEAIVCQGRPVDALYILLKGTMTVVVSENEGNPLTRVFATIESKESSGREIARLFKGEIIGESAFSDGGLPYATVKALADSTVLAIDRRQLIVKLQQDVGFAARFYRAIASLHSDKLQGILNRLGYSRHTYSQGQPLDENIKYEDELDFSILEQMSLAATRFDWMLKRLGSTTKQLIG